MIKNIVTVWYVFMQLSMPYPTFAGIVIGGMLGMLAISTPGVIGFDFFHPPQILTWVCERLFNPA